jgi:hypothetical protein
VLEGGSYAGDARLENVPPGQDRLITYGVDLQTEVVVQRDASPAVVETGKVVKGILQVRRSTIEESKYVVENKSPADKAVVIEQQRSGDETLVEPAGAEEMTDELYRFRRSVAAGKVATFTVRLRTAGVEQVKLLDVKTDELAAYVRAPQIPEAVRKALDGILRARSAAADAARQLAAREGKLTELTSEQSRIRENIKTVAANSEYSTRLLKKLDEQETTIETLQKEAAQLRADAEARRAALEDQVRDLSVE